MSVRADPLRNTLDHLALDPGAKDDRKYLVSMLRRLGYSDEEIKQALGVPVEGSRVIELEYRKGHASGAGAFSVVEGSAPDGDGGLVEFTQRDPTEGESQAFVVAGPLDDWPAAPETTWSETTDEGWSEPPEELSQTFADATTVDDWSDGQAWDATEHAAPAEEALVGFSVAGHHRPTSGALDVAVAHGWIPEDGDSSVHGVDHDNPWDAEGAEPVSAAVPDDDAAWEGEDTAWGADDEAVTWDTPVEFEERSQAEAAAWPTDDAAWEEPGTAWDDTGAPHDAPEEAWVAPDDGAWPDDAPETWESEDVAASAAPELVDESAWSTPELADAPDEGSWAPEQAYQVTDAPAGAWTAEEAWQPAEEDMDTVSQTTDADGAFSYGEFRLYTRMVELSTGREQRIYFFAKNEPKSGEPCSLPAGYIVEENARTGLPFLRRDLEAGADMGPAGVPDDGPGAEHVETAHCLATTKAGAPCKNAPAEGMSFCTVHKGRA